MAERRARAARLRARGDAAVAAFLQAQIGASAVVLVEQDGRGRTGQFAPACVGADAAPGALLPALVTGVADGALQVRPLRRAAGTLAVEVLLEAADWPVDAVEQATRAARAAWVSGADEEMLVHDAELALVLSDDAALRALNCRWRGRDSATNVLSFPASDAEAPADAPRLLGDVALALETLAREARAGGRAFADHLAHLTVHGVLHLLGYDHIEEDEGRVMEMLETRILAGLGIADPYASDDALPETR